MHIIDPENNNIGGNGIVGGGIPIGCGVAMGVKLESSDSVVLCFMGDGAANNGVFGESLNLAVIYNLPVIFIVENNEFAGTTPMRQSTGVEHLAKRAEGYGLPGMTVFGNDVLEMHKHVSSAVSRARAGSGPTLIEARTYRHHGHHARDKGEYMPDSHVREWKASDPIGIIEQHLNYLKTSKADMKVVENDVENTIRSAVAFGENAKQPDIDSFLQKIHRLYA
jgi:pyruvate dehydrogenase E1 component alpha subunit